MLLVPVPADVVETGELERQLEREQILLAEIQVRYPLDPLEPLTHGVGVDVERPRARGHAAAIGEEALERLDEARTPPAVVLEQLLDGDPVAVVWGVIHLEVHEVLVGTEPLVGDRTALPHQRAADA